MRILTTICARAGSKGLKSKNTREFLGRPLCAYTLSAYRLFLERFGAQYGDFALALNTDSEALKEQFARSNTPFICVPRSEDLAGDSVPKPDVIRETLAFCEQIGGEEYDAVLDLDLTSPLRRAVDIKNCLDAFLASPGAEIALTLTEARRNPRFNQLVKNEEGFYEAAIKSDFVARQQAPEVFDANASIYVYSPAYLKGSSRIFLKAHLAASMMPDTAVLDIDSERDFELMGLLAGYFYKTDAEFCEVRDNIESFYGAS
ncbi:MAG: acylneuraminate cytidylyltransferase family protein [Oscillospiraceae bacterium]|nr:acylneuraminate cytidylyltransferase family protein [Oscillospiraceae bacterium]